MLAASSGIDMRGVLRTLRPVGRDTSRDSGTRIRFLLGSAASSSTAGAALAVAWMAWASVWLIAFMVKTPCVDGMQQRLTRQRLLLAPAAPGNQTFTRRRPSARRPAKRRAGKQGARK